jgi:SAM-dependent methyltransferase
VRLIDFYDAQGWGAESATDLLPRQRAARDQIVAAVAALVAEAGAATRVRVLDVGCGDGSFLHHLATYFTGLTSRRWPSGGASTIDYIGVDYSPHQLAKAARLPYRFLPCDLGDGIPLPDASVDVIHAAEVIEHLYDPDLLIEECARVLRPGGALILTTPNLHAWYNRALFLFGIQPIFHETSSRSTTVGAGALRLLKQDTRPVGHLRLFNRTALRDLVRREGFTPTRVRGARFHGVPGALVWLDSLMRLRPSLASILVVVATKR